MAGKRARMSRNSQGGQKPSGNRELEMVRYRQPGQREPEPGELKKSAEAVLPI